MKYVFKDDSPWIDATLIHHLGLGEDPTRFAEGETLDVLSNLTFEKDLRNVDWPYIATDKDVGNEISDAYAFHQLKREKAWFATIEPLPTDQPPHQMIFQPSEQPIEDQLFELFGLPPNGEWEESRNARIKNLLAPETIGRQYLRNTSRLYHNWRPFGNNPNDPDFILIGRKLKYILETLATYPVTS